MRWIICLLLLMGMMSAILLKSQPLFYFSSSNLCPLKVEIAVSTLDFTDINKFSFPIVWHPSVLKFEKISEINLPNLTEQNFDVDKILSGELFVDWSYGECESDKNSDVTLADHTIIFKIEFSVLRKDVKSVIGVGSSKPQIVFRPPACVNVGLKQVFGYLYGCGPIREELNPQVGLSEFGEVVNNRLQSLKEEKDYALLFAVNDYKQPLSILGNPIPNSHQIAEELKTRYGFKTEVFENPTASQIEQKISEYKELFARNKNGQYPENGQLFVFFSGHGTENLNIGYFLPAGSNLDKLRETALDYNYLRQLINSIKCKHILVAVDACYSAYFDEKFSKRPDFLFRRPGELDEYSRVLANHNRYRSRLFFSSDAIGDLTPDKSDFAKKLLEGLRSSNPVNGFMTSSELFALFVEKASPTPRGGDFGDDEAGSAFLFFNVQRQASRDKMVFIHGGNFQMGDLAGDNERLDEKPHPVLLSDFLIGKYEVTFEEYEAFCNATGHNKPGDEGWGRGNHPVINVDWYDAVEYCNWLSNREGLMEVYIINKTLKDLRNVNENDDKRWTITLNPTANGYRLPTEAEWEYVSRQGGQQVRFGNGKNVIKPTEVNFDASSNGAKNYSLPGENRQKTMPTGSFLPNSFGLFDMSGNVWEWCWDWYDSNFYKNSPYNSPKGPDQGSSRILRGGSWNHTPEFCRTAYRGAGNPVRRNNYTGFRLARTP